MKEIARANCSLAMVSAWSNRLTFAQPRGDAQAAVCRRVTQQLALDGGRTVGTVAIVPCEGPERDAPTAS